jgi:peptide/nickel transport system permease protein
VFQFLIGRVIWTVMLFLVLTLVIYCLFFMIPADPLQTSRASDNEGLPIKNLYALNGPFYEDWAKFVWRIVAHQDLGHSITDRQPVTTRIAQAAPVTLSLIIGGMVAWLLIAIPLGVFSALHPRSLLDRFGVIFVLIGISVHPIWLGLILRYVFAARLNIAPAGGYCNVVNPVGNCGGPVDWTTHLIMPWFTFALLFAAVYVRMVRASVMETMHEDYVRTARAKGSPEKLVIRRHVLRNALTPLVAMMSADFAMAIAGPIGGAILIERVYGLPGIGNLVVQSYQRRDLPMIIGITISVMVLILLLNLIADIVLTVLDPRLHVSPESLDRPDPQNTRIEVVAVPGTVRTDTA